MTTAINSKSEVLKTNTPTGKLELLYGYGFGISSCVVIAFSSIFIHKTTQSVNPMLSVFLTFLFCTIWFNILNFKSIGLFYRKLLQDKKSFVIINVCSAILWILTFIALKYISPVLYISMFVGTLPTSTYLIMLIQKKEKLQLRMLITTLLITATLIAITLVEREHIAKTTEQDFYIGILLTVISSIPSALYMIYSKQLSVAAELKPSQVIAVRFHFLVLSTGIICLVNNSFGDIGNVPFSNFILMAFLSSIVPMFLLQKTIHLIGALKTSFISPFTPIFTYLVLLISGQPTPVLLLPLVLGLTVILLYHVFVSVTKKI